MTSITTTDPQDELLTEVDKNNKIIGSISRKTAHRSPDKIYRTIYVIVINPLKKILLQKRSATKDLYPDCWDLSVGGHVKYGVSYIDTAIRELEEELGLRSTKKSLHLLGEIMVKLPTCNEFFQVFEYKLKQKDKVVINKSEVNEVNWMDIDTIKKSIKNRSLKWYPSPIQIIDAFY